MLRALSAIAQFVQGLVPSADIFNTDPASVAVNSTLYRQMTAHLSIGGGGTGTAKLTVEACSAADGTGATAIPFLYKKSTTGDTFGELTEAAVAADGITTTAGTNDQYLIEVNARALPAGLPWVRIQTLEVVNSPVVGSLMWILTDGYENDDPMPTALS